MAKIYIGGNTINISRENTKMGKVSSFSLVPGLTCPAGVPCIKDCYACRMCRLYKDTLNTYRENTRAVLILPQERIVRALASYINGKNLKVFRWNVAGDFIIPKYWDIAVRVAEECPNTQFLAFTKVYATEKRYRPKNFALVLSVWQDYKPRKGTTTPLAYYDDGTYPIPKEAKECSGKCDECFKCFYMKPGTSVVFKKH